MKAIFSISKLYFCYQYNSNFKVYYEKTFDSISIIDIVAKFCSNQTNNEACWKQVESGICSRVVIIG